MEKWNRKFKKNRDTLHEASDEEKGEKFIGTSQKILIKKNNTLNKHLSNENNDFSNHIKVKETLTQAQFRPNHSKKASKNASKHGSPVKKLI